MFGSPWWMLLFAVIGLLAVITAILTLFFSLGRRPQDISVTQVPPVDSEDFLLGISGTINAPLVKGGGAQLLNNGVEIYPAILEALTKAERTINFMAYIWEPGKVSDQILHALCERASKGVEVRVMLDGMGGMHTPDEQVRKLQEAGGKVEWFRQFRLGKITRFHKRNHRRAIVIDGKVGFTGGAAVGDGWLGDAQDPKHWRDMMVQFTGCAASNLQSAFTQLWASVCGEILMGPSFYPHEDEMESRGEELSRHINVISSPADEAHPLRKFFWLSIRSARERLYITTPYFVPDEDTREVIAHRARHGVDVRLLLPGEHIDAKPIRWAGQSYYHDLLKAGVRIFEYQPTFIHSKTLVVDGKWAIVGSANLDIRSKELNQENVIGILDREFGTQLEQTFVEDLEKAREIKLETWRKRGIGKRFLERFFVLFAEQY